MLVEADDARAMRRVRAAARKVREHVETIALVGAVGNAHGFAANDVIIAENAVCAFPAGGMRAVSDGTGPELHLRDGAQVLGAAGILLDHRHRDDGRLSRERFAARAFSSSSNKFPHTRDCPAEGCIDDDVNVDSVRSRASTLAAR